MSSYYREKLSAARLKRVYEIASPRIVQYLEAEIDYVVSRLKPRDRVLELGCGYGRVLERLHGDCPDIFGIDSSLESLKTGKEYLKNADAVKLLCMDAVRLGFGDGSFDVVICIQNGISAFHINPAGLISEIMRVLRRNGKAFFSSYSENFWDDRLRWFEDQAREGLLGEIDYERTGNGVIVCKDGFSATTLSADDFKRLTDSLDAEVKIFEVDKSSLFCEIIRR